MLIEGNVYEGISRLLKIGGSDNNLLMWQNIDSGRYGVHLYEKSPEVWDEDFLLYNYRKDFDSAEEIFKKVSDLLK